MTVQQTSKVRIARSWKSRVVPFLIHASFVLCTWCQLRLEMGFDGALSDPE